MPPARSPQANYKSRDDNGLTAVELAGRIGADEAGSAARGRSIGRKRNFPSTPGVLSVEPVVSDDASLIDSALAGDTGAFGQLVERYQDRLYNALVRFLGSAEDARDVTQDTFLQALTKLRTFRRESAFYTWLYRIGFNLAMSRRRREKPCVSIDRLTREAGAEPSDNGAPPDRGLLDAERATKVQLALGRLAEEQRQVVVLREIENCSYETMAEILDVPIGTVRSRLFRARLQLKEYLEEVLQEEVEELT